MTAHPATPANARQWVPVDRLKQFLQNPHLLGRELATLTDDQCRVGNDGASELHREAVQQLLDEGRIALRHPASGGFRRQSYAAYNDFLGTYALRLDPSLTVKGAAPHR